MSETARTRYEWWNDPAAMLPPGKAPLSWSMPVAACLLLLNFPPNLASINPIYTIRARSLYDAGYQVGVVAKARIHQWFQGEEMKALANFVKGEGNQTFASLRRDNAREFPELVEELKGMAHGAQVPLDWIWMANLVPEPIRVSPIAARSTAQPAPSSTSSPITTDPVCGIFSWRPPCVA